MSKIYANINISPFFSVGELSSLLTRPLEPLDLPLSEQQELGYMMHRDDFERVSICL